VSNRRRLRKRPEPEREPRETMPRYPYKAPALSTVRGWLRGLENAGDIERAGTEHTGKPGRPAVLWDMTAQGKEKAADHPLPDPPDREQARRILHEACREEFGISGRQFVRQLDAGNYQCGWKCGCAMPHNPNLRALVRLAAWSRMSVATASRPE
jgi:hypothetical protein